MSDYHVTHNRATERERELVRIISEKMFTGAHAGKVERHLRRIDIEALLLVALIVEREERTGVEHVERDACCDD